MANITPAETDMRIFKIRGHLVVLDSDLAAVYGVETRQFNRAVLRNQARFPVDFGFVLTRVEFTNLMCQFGTSRSHGGRRKLPRVFTEHGAIMVAGILNSSRAVAMSVAVVRAFVSMRRETATHADLERRLDAAERVLVRHDESLRDVYQKLRPLILPEKPSTRRIGFRTVDSGGRQGDE